MHNLFPKDDEIEENNIERLLEEPIDFKGSYLFDFEKGDFVIDSDGTIAKCDDFQAYKQWCQKALLTNRYNKLCYSNLYGQDFKELINSNLNKSAIELEIKRMIEETLIVNPRTKDVNDFSFKWSENKEEVYCIFEVISIENNNFKLDTMVKVG